MLTLSVSVKDILFYSLWVFWLNGTLILWLPDEPQPDSKVGEREEEKFRDLRETYDEA